MNIILFILSFLFFVSPVLAQETSIPPECRILPNHVADSDVAYESGVDVDGNHVVPADINTTVIDVPETMVVPLSIDLGRGLEATTGFLEISKNGRVMYDGKDVTSQVYTMCGQKMPTPDDEQNKQENIKSEQQTYEIIE